MTPSGTVTGLTAVPIGTACGCKKLAAGCMAGTATCCPSAPKSGAAQLLRLIGVACVTGSAWGTAAATGTLWATGTAVGTQPSVASVTRVSMATTVRVGWVARPWSPS